MRRVLPALILTLLACQAVGLPLSRESPSPASILVSPAPVATTTPRPTFTVYFHPDGGLFVGDQVSLEVIAPPEFDLNQREVKVQLGDEDGEVIASQGFAPYGLLERQQATFYWAWDTRGFLPGSYTLFFSLVPEGPSWVQAVFLNPQGDLPPPEPEAHWAMAESACCQVFYLTHTAAERDLPQLLATLDAQAEQVVAQLGLEFSEPIQITFLSRVLGHGGFAAQEIAISYLDRNYASSDTAQVVHHEMVHRLDAIWGGDLKPTILAEGLAVYLSGGHFKPEPLIRRAAALLDLGWYIPLRTLADAFYPSQHEIGYLQAGALVAFMVEQWGWEKFEDLYQDIHRQASGKPSDALEEALIRHLGITLEELEDRLLAYLRRQPIIPDLGQDVYFTVAYYEVVRQYQQAYDPSAYFLTAWLVDGKTLREKGIVADVLRHPMQPENLVIETLLVSADEHLRAGQYEEVEHLLDAVKAVMRALDKGDTDPFSVYPLAQAYARLIQGMLACGYEPQRIELSNQSGQVWGIAAWPQMRVIPVVMKRGSWILLGGCP
ncbi:MAG: hypothetical protein AB1345_09360 [Chloroflexota bacterium]